MPDDAVSAFGGLNLEAVEEAVGRALAEPRGDPDDTALNVLGYGEISLVVGWPTEGPTVACKRLPVFPSGTAAFRYRDHFATYLDRLRSRGVHPVHSEFHTLEVPHSARVVGYVLQPVLAGDTLGPDVLRRAEPDPTHPMLHAVVDHVSSVTDSRTGFDAQISNWAQGPDGLRYLDVTTPMCFDDSGRLGLDLGLFLAAYPYALRAVIGRLLAPGIVAAYRDPRHVLVDMAANLIKERLSEWIPAVLDVVNDAITPEVTHDEVRRYYRSDARLWEVMLRLRRADRWWQHNIRRREYAFLLPGHIER